MSLHSSPQGAGSIGKTTNLIDYRAAFTVMCWVYVDDATPSAIHYPCAQGVIAGSYYALASLPNDGSGVTHLMVEKQFNSGASYESLTGTTVVAQNAWNHIALVRTSTTQLLGYLNGVLEVTLNHADVSGGTAGDYQNYLHYMQGFVDGYKAWSTNLSAAAVAAEMRTKRPLDLTSLNAWLPTFPGSGENRRDYSGFGPDFTITGTLTDDNPAPVSYGAPTLWVIKSSAAVDVTVTANLQTVTVTTLAPTVQAGATIAANLQTITSSQLAPTVVTGSNVAASLQTATVSRLVPTVVTGSNYTVGLLTATATSFAPTVQAGSNVVAALQAATVTSLAPATSAGATTAASLLTDTVTIFSPTVVTGSNVTAGLQTATVTARPAVATGVGMSDATVAAALQTMTLTTVTPHLTSASARVTVSLKTVTVTQHHAIGARPIDGPTTVQCELSVTKVITEASVTRVDLMTPPVIQIALHSSITRARLENGMANWLMKQGDRLPVLSVTLLDVNGDPIDVTGLTVDFHMRKVGATTLAVSAPATLITPGVGHVCYTWAAGDTAIAGDYEGEFQINYSGDRALTCPNRDYISITITPQLG